MARIISTDYESRIVKTLCSVVVKGHWDVNLKQKIGTLRSSVVDRVLLLLSPYGFTIYWPFFNWVESIPQYNHSLKSSWTMICILTKEKHFKLAQNLLEKVAHKDFLSSPSVLNALVNENDGPEVNSHVLSWLVIFYAKSNMNSDAIQVFEHMRVSKLVPHLHACTAILNSLVKEGLTDTVWKIYKKMIKVGVLPNLHLYNVLIHSCCKSHDSEKAEEFLSEMESRNIAPDLFTYNTLISLYCKRSLHYEAFCVQDRMEKRGVKPDIVTYNSLIYSYCREGRMREATRLFNEIDDVFPNEVTYTTLIDGFCRVNDLDEALHLRDVMESKGMYPGIVTYNTILRKLCRDGRIRDGNKLLMEMSERNIIPDNVTCNTLINAYSKIGDTLSASKVKNKMLESGLIPDRFTYKALIHGFCKAQELDGAKQALLDMIRAGFSPGSCTYYWIVELYCNQSLDESVLEFLDEIALKSVIVDISVYRAVIRGLCKKERIVCARKVFSLMQSKGISGDAVVFSSLSFSFFRACDIASASALLDEMYKLRLMVTIKIYKSINASYAAKDGCKLNEFWEFLVQKRLISEKVHHQIKMSQL